MLYFLLLILLFIASILFKSFTLKSTQVTSPLKQLSFDERKAIQNFSKALQYPTVSYENPQDIQYSVFDDYLEFIRTSYPLIFSHTQVEMINQYAYIIRYPGTNAKLKPVGFMSHYDVVPVLKGTEQDWTYPPFSGHVDDSTLWGRGTLDFKIGMISLLEALSLQIEAKFIPERDTYLLFGFDEEISGIHGAQAIVAHLESKGIHFEAILDEGGALVDGMFPGINETIGVIGLAEKGMVRVDLALKGSGGHASQPKNKTNIGRIAAAIAALEEKQFPAEYNGAVRQLFKTLAPHMPFALRTVFANDGLFKPLIQAMLLKSPSSAALIRSTIAPTIFHAGEKENVLPEKAHATLNIRLIPGDSLEKLHQRIQDIIQDPEIEITLEGYPATRLSSSTSPAFSALVRAGKSVYPDALFAPYLMMAGSDARHYDRISDATYRFFPLHISAEDLQRIHGTNECVSIDNYLRSIRFYHEAINQLSSIKGE